MSKPVRGVEGTLPDEVLHAALVLGDQNVVGQRVEPAVVGKLLSAVVGFGGGGEHLED